MNKPRIIAIVVLMSTALLGLVLLQVNWVRSALALKEQEFDKNVYDALYEVVLDHKQGITSDMVRSFVRTHETVKEHLIIINRDTIRMPSSKFNTPGYDTRIMTKDGMDGEQDFSVIRRSLPWEEDVPLSNPQALLRSMQIRIESPADHDWYTSVLRDIAAELPLLPISRNVDMNTMRDLLDRKLIKRGIDLNFEFAVNRIGSQEIMCEAKLCSKEEVLAAGYRANMFPDQFLSQPTFLYVHFPKKFGFLLRSMWIRLGTSVTLILLITGCFAFVVWTIFRQKKLSDMKSDFINNMTHEFKTPIATLSLAGQAITDPGFSKNPQRLDRFGHVIVEESGKLGTHVERILQMAMIDKGELKLNKQPVDLHDVIHHLVANYQLRMQRPEDSIVADLRASQPIFLGDPMHLSNLVDNLLDNAVKYSKPDKVTVSIETRNETGRLVVTIKDEGIGMKKETLKRIFERFYRAGTGNVHNVKGFGLGLSYVKYVADAHDGEVRVKSEPGIGSTFEVRFPV